MQYLVQVVERSTETVVENLGIMSQAAAIRVERGVNINLNHSDYFTRIVEAKDEQNGEQNTTDPS